MPYTPSLGSIIAVCVAAPLVFVGSVGSAHAGQTAVEAIIAEYDRQCQAMQADVLPDIDADLEAPPPKATLKIEDDAIFEVEINGEGKTATVVHADFGCTNFGHPWCGLSGSCTSYLIVDDTVFEWKGGSRPQVVKGGDTVLISRVVGGFSCLDGNGAEGFGAAPCYEVIVWDEKRGTFWSSNGDLQFRSDLSLP